MPLSSLPVDVLQPTRVHGLGYCTVLTTESESAKKTSEGEGSAGNTGDGVDRCC